VQIEINRAEDVSAVYIAYGNKQADITERIGHIKAAQAAANALADIFSAEKILTGASFVVLLNGAVQTGAEAGIGDLEAEKERLAAAEQAEIEGIDSAARVKTLLLGMHTLAVDSAEAALLMRQEIARMAALYREKSELESRIAERNSDLASRYFADPVHRLAADWRMIEANLGFEDASAGSSSWSAPSNSNGTRRSPASPTTGEPGRPGRSSSSATPMSWRLSSMP
jgi:hypothetical protein